MASLQDNNNTKIPQDEESMPISGMNREMSIATRRYAGEKGYLDEDDKIIRKYDKDGDGKFTIDEAKSMAADFRRALLSQEMFRKVIISMAVLLVVSWAGNFGLIFASKLLFCSYLVFRWYIYVQNVSYVIFVHILCRVLVYHFNM